MNKRIFRKVVRMVSCMKLECGHTIPYKRGQQDATRKRCPTCELAVNKQPEIMRPFGNKVRDAIGKICF